VFRDLYDLKAVGRRSESWPLCFT